MLYEDFINELLNWQGIFDGFIPNPGAYKEYFRLISKNVNDVETLKFCLEEHQNNKNKFFPKPFEINDYAEEFKKMIEEKLYHSPFYKEILEMRSLISIQKDYIINKKDTPANIEIIEKLLIENEKQLKDLEEKRNNLLK